MSAACACACGHWPAAADPRRPALLDRKGISLKVRVIFLWIRISPKQSGRGGLIGAWVIQVLAAILRLCKDSNGTLMLGGVIVGNYGCEPQPQHVLLGQLLRDAFLRGPAQ